MSLQIMREERARIAAQMNELAGKSDWDAATDAAAWDKAVADLNAKDGQIARILAADKAMAEAVGVMNLADRAEQLGRDKGKPALTQYARWLAGGDAALSAAEWTSIRNTMSTSTNSEGGFTVQTTVAAQVVDYMKAYGGMRDVATVVAMSQGNTLQFPLSDGTSETGEWIGQNTTATAADLVFGSVSVPVFKASSKIVAVPYELLQDSQIDVEAFVNKRLGTRLGRITNTGYTTGNGTTAPNGIITAASTGSTFATGNTLSYTYAGLLALIHSIDPAYRVPGAAFMMNDKGVQAVRSVLDGQSRPIFTPGYESTQGGQPFSAPDRLMGYRLVTNQDIAVPAANAKSIAFGDFSQYLIRDVMDVTMFRFTDSAYTKLGQVGFLGWMRTGGNLLDVNAVKLGVNSAT